MLSKFRAYYVEVIRLGLGITVREARYCWLHDVPLGKVALYVEDLRARGITKGRPAKPRKPLFGRLDSRVRRQLVDVPKREPKWLRDIPVGGYEGMQDDIKRMRAEDRGLIRRELPPLEAKAEARARRERLKALRKDWDPPDRYE